MRLSLGGRIIRFLFYPICLAGSVMFLNNYPEFKTMKNYCDERNKCFSYCTSDNFPDLKCTSVDVDITYNNNKYQKFFTYPNPEFNKAKKPDVEKIKANYYVEWNEEKEIRNRYSKDVMQLTSKVLAEMFYDKDALAEEEVQKDFKYC